MSITHDVPVDPVAAFLGDRPHLGLAPEVFTAEKTVAQISSAPQLEWSATKDQLNPDPQEKAIEWVLTVAGDCGFGMDEVVTVLRAFRPDMEAADIREAVYRLYDLAAEVRRANVIGARAAEEMHAERYIDALTDFAGGTR